MKDQILDNDIIITNDLSEVQQEETQTPPPATEAQHAAVESTETDEPERALRDILREKVTEEDAPVTAGRTLVSILGGDFLAANILRRQIWLILLIAAFMVFYTSNRYSCQKSLLEIDKLNKELQDAKYKALSTSSELTEMSRESEVLDKLKAVGDSTIHIPTEPPYKIEVPQ